jgi:redox-sensitive bicupin YhaK (pirin superfamily)
MTKSDVAAETLVPSPPGAGHLQRFASRETNLGDLKIWRALPVREKRLIGPWCFLDRYGPLSFSEGRPMDVAAHPHIGLQTVSWLFDGEVRHFDSLGSEATARPGGVNIMTAGSGIAHAETTPATNSGLLNGVQLWLALPDEERNVEASFQHLSEVPRFDVRDGLVQLFTGVLGDVQSPAWRYGDVVGADVVVVSSGRVTLPLDPAFEHGLFVVSGSPRVRGEVLQPNSIYYLGPGSSEITIDSRSESAHLLLLGGPPFATPILMWWNFVARTPEEIAAARADWQESRRFGPVAGYEGPRLRAPMLSHLARPEPVS